MLANSIDHCVKKAFEGKGMELPDNITEYESYKNLLKQPGRFVAPCMPGYGEVMGKAAAILEKDGCTLDVLCDGVIATTVFSKLPDTKLGQALSKVEVVMKKVAHVLLKGHVYRKAKNGKNCQHFVTKSCNDVPGTTVLIQQKTFFEFLLHPI